MKVAITCSDFGKVSDTPLQLLKESGLEVTMPDDKARRTEQDLIKHIAGCAGVIAGQERYSETVLDASPFLKIIARCGSDPGVVHPATAEKRGIVVFASEFGHVQAVVEYILGTLYTVFRNISEMDSDLRAGSWQRKAGRLFHGGHFGIVGLGRVGKAVAEVFSQLGCKVSFHDPFVESMYMLPCGRALYNVPLNELVAWSDVLSLHCSYDEAEGPIMTDARLKRMPRGAVLINTAHGKLVEEASLYSALNTGHLAGAILDVFAKEPYAGPLVELDTALLTPHVAGFTRESRLEMELGAVRAVLAVLGIEDA